MAEHKHSIRSDFHVQLGRLWETNKFLKEHRVDPRPSAQNRPPADIGAQWGVDDDKKVSMREYVANLHQRDGYRFVPLVRKDIALLCSLKVLFLRHDGPGAVLHAGDIDNRIKTLIDALRMPSTQELRGNEIPKDGEDPFFVLMEDDSQVTHLEVETDRLLDPPRNIKADLADVRLVITVEVRPYDVTMFNLSFAG